MSLFVCVWVVRHQIHIDREFFCLFLLNIFFFLVLWNFLYFHIYLAIETLLLAILVYHIWVFSRPSFISLLIFPYNDFVQSKHCFWQLVGKRALGDIHTADFGLKHLNALGLLNINLEGARRIHSNGAANYSRVSECHTSCLRVWLITMGLNSLVIDLTFVMYIPILVSLAWFWPPNWFVMSPKSVNSWTFFAPTCRVVYSAEMVASYSASLFDAWNFNRTVFSCF